MEWVGVPFSRGPEPQSPALQVDSLPSKPPCKPPGATLTSLLISLAVQWINTHGG